MTNHASNSRLERLWGRRLVVRLEWEGALSDSPSGGRFVPLEGTIESVIVSPDGYPNFVVHLVRPVALQADFDIERMLVVGIDMNLIDELFGTPHRPSGLPVLAGIYRLQSEEAIERVRASNKPPPSEEFVGRGEVNPA